jgi:uncharacterized protein (DUF1778 family)
MTAMPEYRITLDLPPDDIVSQAATMLGMTLEDFVLEAARLRAAETITAAQSAGETHG